METFLGSLMLVPYTIVPVGWARCNGQLMQITQNSALFSLLGTTYGGDGLSTFALPNLMVNDVNGKLLTWIICLAGIYPAQS